MGLPAEKHSSKSFPRRELEDKIREWWIAEEEALRKQGDPFGDLQKGDGTVFDILPLIPSHQAVEVVVLLEPILGREIPESVIKRGGYHSVDELLDHMMKKLEAFYNAG